VVVAHYRNLTRSRRSAGTPTSREHCKLGRDSPRDVIRNLGVQCLNVTVQSKDHDGDEKGGDEHEDGEDSCDWVAKNPTPPTVRFDEPVERGNTRCRSGWLNCRGGRGYVGTNNTCPR